MTETEAMPSMLTSLIRAASVADRLAKRALADYGITAVQFEILEIVSATPGISGSDLRRQMPGIESARLTYDTNALEAAGLLRRKIHTTDARQRLYWLTAKGGVCKRKAQDTFAAEEARLMKAADYGPRAGDILNNIAKALGGHDDP